ncbi:MAG: hypothetical protein KKG06_07240 [Bacteroidetes bacterium]|nr:hypothetical protein [Bacteroidota bacterium]
MKFINFIFISIILFNLIGCCSSKDQSPKQTTAQTAKYNIVIGSGGGFTGIYSGYYIDTLGNITSWEGRVFADTNLKYITTLSREQLDKISKLVLDKNVLNTNYKNSGNISSYIQLSCKNLKHSVSWSGFEPNESVPVNIREFHSQLRKIIVDTINRQSH